jgi:hypothetical protein
VVRVRTAVQPVPPRRHPSPPGHTTLLLWALLLLTPVFRPQWTAAEVRSSVSIDAINSLVFGAAEPLSAGLATAELDLEAVGNRDVRSRLQLRTTLLENAPSTTVPETTAATLIDVPRAEVRWRMNAGDTSLRFTVGRTRLTWGEGQLYNAGDVINGVRPSETDLTATTLRDETQWLTVAYVPLGRFSFLEAVALLPMSRQNGTAPVTAATTEGGDPDEEDSAGGGAATPAVTTASTISPAPVAEAGGGGRIQGQLLGLKGEVGYLYRGFGETHQPYLALQGNLLVDWYTAVSWTEGPADAPGIAATGGLFHTLSGDRSGTITARLETLWTGEGEQLRLFPELTWAPSQLLTFYLRAEALILEEAGWRDQADPDAVVATGIRWTPLTGLTLSLSGVGDGRRDLAAAVAGVRYTF